MNIREIKEMINLMNENNLTELEIEKEGLRVRLKKGAEGQVAVEQFHHNIPVAAPVAPPMPAPQAAAQESPRERTLARNLIEIKSPMVGTFYRAPSPESPPFVEMNQNIEIGQVVCIVEAMKLMNEIKSEVAGKIIEVLVGNGEPVEFDQPLFKVQKA